MATFTSSLDPIEESMEKSRHIFQPFKKPNDQLFSDTPSPVNYYIGDYIGG